MSGRRAVVAPLPWVLVLGLAACASSRRVAIEVTRAPALADAGVPRVLRIGRIDIPRVADLDVGEETRRFLESDLRERTGVEVRLVEDVEAAGAADTVIDEGTFELTGSGTYEETTLASLEHDRDEDGPPAGSVSAPPVHAKSRWMQAYRLRLHLEIRKPGALAPVWSESFDREEPPRERGERLFALYSVLEPVGEAVRGALGAHKVEETRVLLPAGGAGGGR